MTLGQEIIGRLKTIEVRIIEVDIQTTKNNYRNDYGDNYRDANFGRHRNRSEER